jgi:MFS family permease
MTPTPALRKGWLLAVLLVAPFMAQADVTIANVATPSIQADLRTSGSALELMIGAYLIAFAVLLITGARLGQAHGYRRVYLAGIGIFTMASLLCGLAPDATVLIAARALQGAGAALMFPQTLSGIQLNFSGPQRTRAIGFYSIALSAGAVVGQILGGALISANLAGTQWRAIFLINVPVGLAAIAAAVRHLPADDRRASPGIDLVGLATLSASLVLIVVPLILGRPQGWPLWTWVCLAASLPAFRMFLVAQREVAARGGSPLVNVQVIARPAVSWGLLTLMIAVGTYYSLLFTLAQYLQRGLGRSALVSALTLIPWVAAFGLAGQLVRRLPDRLGPLVPAAGCLLLATAYAAISLTLFSGNRGEGPLLVLMGAGGLGLGIQFSSMIAHLTNAVPSRYAADISGVSTTTIQVGGALGVAAFGTLYMSLTHAGTAQVSHAFAVVTAAFAAVALLAAAAAHRATHASAR